MCLSLSLGLALVLLLGSLPNLAAAYDRIRVTPKVSVSQLYESNVFNSESNEESDLATVVEPSFELNLQNDRSLLELSYEFKSTYWVNYPDLNAIDHRVLLSGARSLSHRLTLFGGANYLHLPKGDDVVDNDVLLRFGNDSVKSYGANGGLRYALDRASNVSMSFRWSERDQTASGDEQQRLVYDPETLALTLAWQRSLTARDSVGARISRQESTFRPEPDSTVATRLVRQEVPGTLPDCPKGFDGPPILINGVRQCFGTVSIPDNESSTTSLGASWSRIWSPRWSSELALGATLVETDQGGESLDPSLSMNGVLSVTRRTRSSELTLSYSKFTQPSTTQGTEVDVDTAQIEFRHSLSRHLGTELTATWSQTTSASSSSSDLADKIDWEVLSLNGLLDWRLTEHFSTFLQLTYRQQDGSGNRFTGGGKRIDGHRAILGFRYNHPIDLY